MGISSIYLILAFKIKMIFGITHKISFKIVMYLLRYGKVVSKEDWKYIKKYCKRKVYRKLRSKKSKGYCYYYSRVVAYFLKDAQLMYCCIKCQDHYSGHAVVVKNNCVYDTNQRKHFEYNEYLELFDAKVYKMFSAEEYRKESFFDDIRQGFAEWCAANNAYCNAQ